MGEQVDREVALMRFRVACGWGGPKGFPAEAYRELVDETIREHKPRVGAYGLLTKGQLAKRMPSKLDGRGPFQFLQIYAHYLDRLEECRAGKETMIQLVGEWMIANIAQSVEPGIDIEDRLAAELPALYDMLHRVFADIPAEHQLYVG